MSEPTVVTKTSGDGQYILMIATYVPPEEARNCSHEELATDGQSMKSQFMVVDGDDMNKPVFVANLPYHVNYGLHSEYLDWYILK